MLNYCTDSVFTSQRVLESTDLTQSSRNRYRQIVKDYLRIQGKIRFIQKHTGFARIYYLKSIFPDAMFIHVYRDGRAVANSLNKVHFWSNDLNGWCWGHMKPAYMHEYMQYGREPIVLAGIVWKTLMDLIEEECAELTAKQLLRIRYDELISDLPGTMRKVLSFCGLNYSRRFDSHVRGTRVLDMDTKWRKNLSAREKRLLENCIGKHIIKYGFLL
jgi:hypothetical protein